MFQVEGLLPDQSQDSAWRAHHNVGAIGAQGLLILLDIDASKEHSNLHIITILRKTLILLINLKSQLPENKASWYEHDDNNRRQLTVHDTAPARSLAHQ